MSEITGLSLISAVSKAVRDTFTTTEIKAVYKDKPNQGVAKPYAFVQQVDGEQRPALKLRGSRYYIIDVRCHPEDTQTEVNSWAYGLAEKLLTSLKQINLLQGESSYPIKATKLNWRVEQGVLHVIAYYSIRITEVKDDVAMNNLYYGERVK